VKFKQDAPYVMEVHSLEGKRPLLGKIKLGEKPYKLETEQHAKFSSEQLAEISKEMHD